MHTRSIFSGIRVSEVAPSPGLAERIVPAVALLADSARSTGDNAAVPGRMLAGMRRIRAIRNGELKRGIDARHGAGATRAIRDAGEPAGHGRGRRGARGGSADACAGAQRTRPPAGALPSVPVVAARWGDLPGAGRRPRPRPALGDSRADRYALGTAASASIWQPLVALVVIAIAQAGFTFGRACSWPMRARSWSPICARGSIGICNACRSASSTVGGSANSSRG